MAMCSLSRTTTAVLPCISAPWYKASAGLLMVFGRVASTGAGEGRTACGKYCIPADPAASGKALCRLVMASILGKERVVLREDGDLPINVVAFGRAIFPGAATKTSTGVNSRRRWLLSTRRLTLSVLHIVVAKSGMSARTSLTSRGMSGQVQARSIPGRKGQEPFRSGLFRNPMYDDRESGSALRGNQSAFGPASGRPP